MKKFFCFGLLSAGFFGCTSLLNTDGYRLGTEETTDPNKTACSSCTQKACGDEVAACSEHLFCKDFQHCFDQCQITGINSSSCEASCLDEFWDFGLTTDVTICQSQHCKADCPRPCGGWVYRVDGCASCIQNKCCEQATACSKQPDCFRTYSCYLGCVPGDWGCYLDCNESMERDDSYKLISMFDNCCMSNCSIPCGIGKAWGCVGKTGSVKSIKRDTILNLRFYEPTGVGPIQGVNVLMCAWSDADCDSPLASANSDASGVATLTYEVSGLASMPVRLEISKSGRVHATLTFARPLSYGPPMTQTWLLPTPEELEYLAGLLSVEPDPSRGHVMVYMLDCAMGGARDLVVSVPGVEGATPFYVVDYRPDSSADYTDSLGFAGIFNVPAGTVDMKAHLFEQEDFAVLKKSIEVRPGEISFALIWPQ